MQMPDPQWMKEAIALARKSKSEDENIHPVVGAVLTKSNRVIARSWRGEKKPGEHAEFTAFWRHLRDKDVRGATLYTTLEPCTSRKHGKLACAEWIIARNVSTVVIGMLDADARICGRGVWMLRKAGINVHFFPPELMGRIEKDNESFIALHDPTRPATTITPAGTEREHARAEEEIIEEYCSQDDFPNRCYITGNWEHNRCFESLPKTTRTQLLQKIRRKTPAKLDRVRRDIFILKGINQSGEPNVLSYFSGQPQTGWQTWLLPSRKRDFEWDLTERLERHAVDLAVFLGVKPKDVSIEYAPSVPMSACLKVNRYAADPKDRTTPKIYTFRYCFVRLRQPAPRMLKREYSYEVGGYNRAFRWFHPESLEQHENIWYANADVIRSLHQTFETMMTIVPNSLGNRRLEF